jgi:hypothetical protein
MLEDTVVNASLQEKHLFLLHTDPCWESAELPLKAISSVELLETVESMMV